MKVCVPVSAYEGLQSPVNKDFETTTKYILCSTDSDELSEVNDQDMQDVFGDPDPLKYLLEHNVDAIITSSMRPASRVVLQRRTDISVFKGSGTVADVLSKIRNRQLPEIGIDGLEFSMACSGGCSSCESTTCK